MAFLEKKLLSKKDLFVLFGQNAGRRLYDLIYKCCSSCFTNSYTVSLTQDSTDAPFEEIIFANGLKVIANYNYVNTGEYIVTFDKPIFNSPFDYAAILNNNFIVGGDVYSVQVVPVFFDALSITTYINGIPSDNVLGANVPSILDIKTFN